MSKKYLIIYGAVLVAFLCSFRSVTRFALARCSFNADTLVPFVFHAKDHIAKNVNSNSGPLSLVTGLDNDFYYADSTRRTGYLFIETDVSSLSDFIKRIPLNISIVIDRSGSMGEDRLEKKPYSKIEYAKKAAKLIVDTLDANDYVSVVVYDNFINVIQKATPDTCKETIKKKIGQIMPRGATDLWGGTEKGYKEALSFYEPGRVNRVLLLSDGEANVGLTNTKEICKKVQDYRDSGISLSTFGVGLDYNELLMTSMAENAAGNYYFIDSASKITSLFNQELNGLLHVAAQNTELRITIPQGVTFENIYPYKYTQKGNELIFTFQDLLSGDKRGLLLKYSIADKVRTPLTFSANLRYYDVADRQLKILANSNTVRPVKDKNAYMTHFNKSVIEQAILFSANNNMEDAMTLADEGNYAGAKRLLDNGSLFLKGNNYYVNGSAELKRMDSVNTHYTSELSMVKTTNKDSVHLIQKRYRDESYKLRNKKG